MTADTVPTDPVDPIDPVDTARTATAARYVDGFRRGDHAAIESHVVPLPAAA